MLEGRSIALESVKHVPRRGYDGEGEGGLAHRPSIPRLAASTLSNSRPSAFYPCRYRGSTKARTEPRTFAIPERMLCLSSFSPCLFSPCVRVRACKWRGTQLPRVAPIKGGQENSRGIKIPSRGKRSPSESFSSPRFARFQRHSYGYGSRHPSIPIVSPQITRRRFLHSHIFYCPVFASLSLSPLRSESCSTGKKVVSKFRTKRSPATASSCHGSSRIRVFSNAILEKASLAKYPEKYNAAPVSRHLATREHIPL